MLRLCLLLLLTTALSRAQELRGMWCHAFASGFKSSAQVTQLIADARAGNFNALFVQVRKRGDAYYNSTWEPKATDVSPQSFDPLADLIAKANTGGPKIEIHAWIVTYHVWNSETGTPAQTTHPYRVHPEWLTEKNDGTRWDAGNYTFDQSHPAVQQHTFNVCQDIVSRYAVDGLHFDYVRYSDDSSGNNQPWGYHPVAVQRFQNLTGRTDRPAPTDAQWLQFRRDQVTALVRKVYLHTWKTRPAARVSAALISYGGAPAALTAPSFATSSAYSAVLQDWRGWMQEGILDLAMPMIYKDHDIPTQRADYNAWCAWARDQQFGRMTAAGPGVFRNSVTNSITQIKQTRVTGSGGQKLGGLVAYSYALTNDEGISRATFLDALTDSAVSVIYDPGGTPVFGSAVAAPGMPWKTDASKGHLMGTLTAAGGVIFDGAVLTLTGAATRALKTDATGFYGSVDLPAGSYTLTVNIPGYMPVTQTVTVTGTQVTELPLVLNALNPLPFDITANAWNPTLRRITVTWNSQPGKTYRVELSSSMATWTPIGSGIVPTGNSTTWTSATLPAANRRFFRVVEE